MNPRCSAAFSLTEVLVVIAVVGILSSIAIPSINNVRGAAETSRNKRNAQNLASIHQAGSAAGLEFDGGTLEGTIRNVVTGNTVTENGVFKGTYFGVPELGNPEVEGASRFLSWDGERLIYLINPDERFEQLTALAASSNGSQLAILGENLNPILMTLDEAIAIPGNVLHDGGTWYTLREYNGWKSDHDKLEVQRDGLFGLAGIKLESNHDTISNLFKDFEAQSDDEPQMMSLNFGYADRLSSNQLTMNIYGDQGTVYTKTYDNQPTSSGWSEVVENFALQAGENARVEFTSSSPNTSIGSILREDMTVRMVGASQVLVE